MRVSTIANNLINGNLTDAKRGARSVGGQRLYNYFLGIGWSEKKANAAAMYLKYPSQGTYNNYCAILD